MGGEPIVTDYVVPGVCVEIFDDAETIRLRVRSDTEMTAWTLYATDPVDDLSPRVATTVKYGDGLYAVSSCEETPTGWLYDLIPWPEGELSLRIYELSAEAFARREQERIERLIERSHSRTWSYIGVLIGLLPGSIQNAIGELYDYDAHRWALISSVVTACVGLGQALADAFAGAPGLRGLIGAYLFLDGAVRLAMALVGEVCGLLPVEVLYFLTRAIWRFLRR